MGLTARLISQHFGVLGERVAQAIADIDLETATEAERERLSATLCDTARVLAQARAVFDHERAGVANLRTSIANDEKAAGKLAERLAAGTISAATVALFREALEANKARLPRELQEQADALGCMDRLQKILDAMSRRQRLSAQAA
jgi:hypothetical protein